MSEAKERDTKGRFNISVLSLRIYALRAENQEGARDWVSKISAAATERWTMLSTAKSLAEKYMQGNTYNTTLFSLFGSAQLFIFFGFGFRGKNSTQIPSNSHFVFTRTACSFANKRERDTQK